MKMIFGRPAGLTDTKQRYCPGCGHGIVHRLIAELMIELDIRERTVGIAPVGCSVFADEYFNCDMIQPPHGRGPAVSTGIKRARPECIVFSYQGDGDLAAIGTAETVHAAARNENITLIFINNAIYGMTGGQLAPTTLPGMRSTTSVKGRDIYKQGYPIKVCELIAGLDGPYYLERVAVHTPKDIIKTKKALKTAFQNQIKNNGFSLIEVLSMCPTGWGITPIDSKKWIVDKMIPYYPLGVFRDRSKEEK
ncbi:2-oxoglutarate oxidoreductase [candidate division WOR-3 bacterium RBG_13_43_14]|uniref:2-oxoglutarate oxidoreductase n=1 Tax=candidate division WOR-3 bacterium RBG_13_43_14 TaxID=1802590 RepID=A0A1F4UBV2_UNCW3|nr:MAG: 2-oxoglutarate oxidoreductase [candidate division WOR-3 bacterium RBG_13_43_14]